MITPSSSFYYSYFIMIDVSSLKTKRCVVILSGGLSPFNIMEDDTVICADSGILSLHKEDMIPDILIGDMDSLPTKFVKEMERKGVTVEIYPREKDLSDGELAIKRAVAFSPLSIDIFGGKCGRADHILSSFYLLYKIPEEIESTLHLDSDQVILVREGNSFMGSTDRSVVSVLPAFERARVTLKGLRWELKNHLITMGSTLGIHNESTGKPFEVMAEKGDIYLIFADEVPQA